LFVCCSSSSQYPSEYLPFLAQLYSTSPTMSLRVSQERVAEAKAYIDHEFQKGGTLDPEELYKPTAVSKPELNGIGQSGLIDQLLHPQGEMARTLHDTEEKHHELDLTSDADTGGDMDS